MATFLQKRLVPLFAKHRLLIIKLFEVAEISIIFIWGAGGYMLFNDFSGNFAWLYTVGTWFGSGALTLYILTLLPGIIKRLQFLPEYTMPIARILTIFRRHLGILMFLLVFVHLGFVFLLPRGLTGQLAVSKLNLEPGHYFGITAFIMLFPLWITSNDISFKLLGQIRNTIHRLTYVILFILFMHVSFYNRRWAVVMGVLFAVLILSLVKKYRSSRAVQQQTTQSISEETVSS